MTTLLVITPDPSADMAWIRYLEGTGRFFVTCLEPPGMAGFAPDSKGYDFVISATSQPGQDVQDLISWALREGISSRFIIVNTDNDEIPPENVC